MEKHQDIILEKTLALANEWRQKITNNQKIENEFQEKLQKILENKEDSYFLIRLLDSCFQSTNHYVISRQIEKIFTRGDLPSFFSFSERALVRLFLWIGKHVPSIAIPEIIQQVQKETQEVVFMENDPLLIEHLQKRKNQYIKNNINLIGETVLGEKEAHYKLQEYIDSLQQDHIRYLSIKLSNIYSQINTLAFNHTVQLLVYRLSSLYKEAKTNAFVDEKGNKCNKFVNLDMEEYRDVELTVHTFMKTLDQEQFFDLHAGIVLQAYLPDSKYWFEVLCDWSIDRVQRGGAPIKIRIVKGANLAMERIDSSLHNWQLPPYDTKLETDANYKALLNLAIHPDIITAVNIGIASHNLLDLAYAKTLMEERNIDQGVSFEMLEGMANQNIDILGEHPLVLYTPISTKEKFINAIGYLVRRLDEISDPENFLSHTFHLNKSWSFLEGQFINAYQKRLIVSNLPKRTQNRLTERFSMENTTYYTNVFQNEIDTDFILPANRKWAIEIQEKWSSFRPPMNIILSDNDHPEFIQVYDKSNNNLIAKVESLDYTYLYKSIGICDEYEKEDLSWKNRSMRARHKILAKVAILFRENRGELMGVMAAETGKTFTEADAEISEAIDFLEYYPWTLQNIDVPNEALGIGVVISPWNFPVAIPTGGIVAGLAGGNSILFKPSSQAVLCGYFLARLFWEAGVPKEAFHFLPSASSVFEKAILTGQNIKFIIFTGSTEVALRIKNLRKDIPLYAETGGKNTTIVTNNADKDQAIKNIVHSAFGHAGQKCSATSLLLLEKEIFEDEEFKHKLSDAIGSLNVGNIWDLKNKIGPMVSVPSNELVQAMKQLDNDEYWLIEPKVDSNNPNVLHPSVKWNVTMDSYTFQNELFGPLLGVMCFEGIQNAVSIANETGFGLTAGLETLDKDEIKFWKHHIIAGNLYINRPTTGAIVERQAFGGYRKSSIGAGIKAGGPNYVFQFVQFKEFQRMNEYPLDNQLINLFNKIQQNRRWDRYDFTNTQNTLKSYSDRYNNYFAKKWDNSNILGEYNHLHYKKFEKIIIRVTTHDSLEDILLCVGACMICECNFEINFEFINQDDRIDFFEQLFPQLTIKFETDKQIINQLTYEIRLRYLSFDSIPNQVLEETCVQGYHIVSNKPSSYGRIELLNYLKEQSISHRYHRYGNLGV